jgi:hypothetical protein
MSRSTGVDNGIHQIEGGKSAAPDHGPPSGRPVVSYRRSRLVAVNDNVAPLGSRLRRWVSLGLIAVGWLGLVWVALGLW